MGSLTEKQWAWGAATHGPGYLDGRLEAFLGAFRERLEGMSVDELDSNRQALIAAKTQKDHALAEEADRNWEQISSMRCALCRPPPSNDFLCCRRALDGIHVNGRKHVARCSPSCVHM